MITIFTSKYNNQTQMDPKQATKLNKERNFIDSKVT